MKINTCIELVEKWLADTKSVTIEELKANFEAAKDAWEAVDHAFDFDTRNAGYPYTAAYAAVMASELEGDHFDGQVAIATEYVKRYHELTKD